MTGTVQWRTRIVDCIFTNPRAKHLEVNYDLNLPTCIGELFMYIPSLRHGCF